MSSSNFPSVRTPLHTSRQNGPTGQAAGLSTANTGLLVLNDEVIVRGGIGESGERAEDGLASLKGARKAKFPALDAGAVLQGLLRDGDEGETDDHVGTSGGVVKHVEVVIVDLGIDGRGPGVLEGVIRISTGSWASSFSVFL